MSTLEHEYERIATSLRTIGLTDYESKTYVALVAIGPSTADHLSTISRIPRTSTYKVLKSLVEKDFVEEAGGRPTMFRAVPPLKVRERIVSEITGTFSILDSIEGFLSERGTPQLVYTIAGKDRVLKKIGEVIEGAREDLILSTPEAKVIRSAHDERLRDAIRRGVDVTVVVEPFVKAPECTRAIRAQHLLATDVMADGEMALIVAPDLTVCGYTDNPFLARHLDSFLRLMVEGLD